MKHLLTATLLLLLTVSAQAAVKTLDGKFFEQKGSWSTPMMLNCNWDKDLSTVTIYGYYGQNGEFQDVITPVELKHEDPASTDIWFKVAPSIMHASNGWPLHHIDVDYQTTRRVCKDGFGFGGGLVK